MWSQRINNVTDLSYLSGKSRGGCVVLSTEMVSVV